MARLRVVSLPGEKQYLIVLDQFDEDSLPEWDDTFNPPDGCAGVLVFPTAVEVA
jgi:hypothetical protein